MSKSFQESLQALHRKGGPYYKAAEKVLAAWAKAQQGFPEKEVFAIATTHHGESRIPHCVKYDLPAAARLVVVRHDNVCVFLFAGDHGAVDKWLDVHRGLDFVAKYRNDHHVLLPVHVSAPDKGREGMIRTGRDLGANRVLIEMLPKRYLDRLLEGLPAVCMEAAADFGPMVTDDEIWDFAARVPDKDRGDCLMDVLLKLREGDVAGAKNRIDLLTGSFVPVADLTGEQVSQIRSGDAVIVLRDLDPQLFQHFVKTASYRDWMLFLHPDQREFVERDYEGPVRMAGVSGSGKTCVLIHRALRLARKYPDEKVLVLTLNPALSHLIDNLARAARPEGRPSNLQVRSMWELCRDLVLRSEPGRGKQYTRITVATNPYATSEHIDEIWQEFYNAENNYPHYDDMMPVHRSLLVRSVFPRDYVRQEFDYIRSALAPEERTVGYRDMDREGRVFPIDKGIRPLVLAGLEKWEEKMCAVGAIDDVGIVTALYRHLDDLDAEYRCILVDESQDFGTLELKVIRRLAAQASNDLFFCGDAAQSVYTKTHDFREAGIELATRSLMLRQNYRNSREILAAAQEVLTSNFDRRSKGVVNLEIIPPEYANFSTALPALLHASSVEDELRFALGYLDWSRRENGPERKVCIALCGFTHHALKALGEQLQLPVLSGDCDVIEGKVFLSDLEHTKGFEFDSMVILNCSQGVIPHPELPSEESFRELSKLYVAMTRAKSELIVSYSEEPSPFLDVQSTRFTVGQWSDYSDREKGITVHMPAPALGKRDNRAEWNVPAHQFLKYRCAVGLTQLLQDELLDHVTGRVGYLEGKQIRWANVSDFLRDMRNARNRRGVLSNEAWRDLDKHLEAVTPNQRDGLPSQATSTGTQETASQREEQIN